MGIVRDVHLFGDLGLGALSHVQDAWLAFDESPLETLLAAVHIDAFAVLAGDVIQKAPDVRGEVAVLNLDVAALDGELVAALLRDVIPHRAAAKTADVLSESIDHAEAGADDVCGVVHRDHLLPVTRPTVHVLRVARGEVLQFAQLAFVVHFLDEQKLATVDNRLGHHVFQPGFIDGFAKLLAFLDGRGHRHGAHHMLARAQGFERLRRVIGDGGVDVHGINLRILQQLIVIGVALLDIELVGHRVHLRLIAAADSDEVGIRVRLVDGDEFRAEPKAGDGNIESLVTHGGRKSRKAKGESQSHRSKFKSTRVAPF